MLCLFYCCKNILMYEYKGLAVLQHTWNHSFKDIHICNDPFKTKQKEKNKQTNNNLCAFCLTFYFQASYGVQLSSRSVRKRYVFHVPSRTLDGKFKLSTSEVPQSLKVTKTSMDQTKTGLQGAQAYGAERLTRGLSVTLTCPLLCTAFSCSAEYTLLSPQ